MGCFWVLEMTGKLTLTAPCYFIISASSAALMGVTSDL